MTDHSTTVGGSSAARVIACPGSVPLSMQAPAKPPSPYADEGSMLHEAIALIMDEKVKKDRDIIGFELNGVTLTEELYVELVEPALEFFDADLQEDLVDWLVERRVTFQSIPNAFGTADIIGLKEGGDVVVLDWKFGRGVAVNAEENQQGMFYAAAALEDPETAHMFRGAKNVEIIIVQPAFDPPASRWTVPVERLDEFKLKLTGALRLSEREEPLLHTGDHCRWCPAKSICPLVAGIGDQALEVLPKDLPPAKISEWLKKADILEQWIKELRALGHRAIEGGVDIPNWKLVQKRSTKNWKAGAEARVRDFARRSKKVVIADMYNEVLKSPAQVEKVLKTKGLDQAMFADYIVSRSSGTTLAPESDPRPAVPQLQGALKRMQEHMSGL